MKSHIFIFIFFLASHFFVFAQDQECIMYFNDGEFIEGFGKLEVVGKYDIREKIKFRLTKEDEGDYWDFEDVSRITFTGFEMKKTFEYVKIKEREYPQLLELLVDGEVKLYKFYERTRFFNWFNNNNFVKYNATLSSNNHVTFAPVNSSTLTFPNRNEEVRDEHYLIRETEEIATCIDCSIFKSWAKNVSNYLADCDTLVQDLKKHKYSFAELEDAIYYYNDYCVE